MCGMWWDLGLRWERQRRRRAQRSLMKQKPLLQARLWHVCGREGQTSSLSRTQKKNGTWRMLNSATTTTLRQRGKARRARRQNTERDRQSIEEGKSVAVRVDQGGRRLLK